MSFEHRTRRGATLALVCGLALSGCGASASPHVAWAHDGSAHDGSAHDGSAHDGSAHDSARGEGARRGAGRPKQTLPAPWTSWTSHAGARPEPTPPPELPSSEAGRRVAATAERMVEEGTIVRGSCYRYLDQVFITAGHQGWRRRSTVFRGSRNGPYASLDLIQPGDWLWIVNHPDRTPVGTHSVLFLGWEDRAAGYARVVSYVGGAQARPADVTTYDVSRTYSIQRAVDPEPTTPRGRGR